MRIKKIIYLGVVVIALAIGGIQNIRHAALKNQLSDLSMSNIEASANIFDYLSEWWESKVHTCVPRACSAVISSEYVSRVDPMGNTYMALIYNYGPGHELGCVSGDKYAHCWDCETDCIPDI